MAERVIIYTRVSTEEQAKGGTSLTAQKTACLEYCERQEYIVAKVFVEEGESAKTILEFDAASTGTRLSGQRSANGRKTKFP